MNASAPGRPSLSPEDLIDSLMATGGYRSRDEVVQVALDELLRKSAPSKSAPARQAPPLETALDGLAEAFYALDRDWRYTFVNRAAERYYGRPRETLIGRNIWDVFPWSAGTELRARYEEAMRSREPTTFESLSVGQPGRFLEIHLFPFEDGLGVSFQDWTERRAAEAALKESEGRLRLAVEAGRLAVWDIDVATGTIRPSPELNELLGFPRDATPSMDEYRTGYMPGEQQRLQAVAAAALEGGDRFFQTEYRYRRPDDDRVIWLLLRAEIRFDGAGRPAKVVGVLLDITERKQVEEALRESQARLALATEAAELGVWDWDVATNRMIYSDRAKAIYGFPREGELTFAMVSDATHPVDRIRTSAMAAQALDPAVRAKEPYEYRVIWPDGSIRWVIAHGEAVFGTIDGAEKALRYVGTIQDITARKEAEAALQETQARLTALADNLPNGMVYQVLTRPGSDERRFLYVSGSCERLHGVPAEAAVADASVLYGLIRPEDGPRLLEAERAAIAARKPFDMTVAFRHARTGELRWLHTISAPREMPDGALVWDGIQIDVTEQRAADEALRRSEERLRTILNEMPVGVVLARIPDGDVVFRNARSLELLGDSETVPRSVEEYTVFGAIHPDGTPYRAEEYPGARSVIEKANVDQEEMIYRRPDGRVVQFAVSSSAIQGLGGEAYAITAFNDITERKRAEEHQRLLINELNHRVKNTLATVQSIAAQSFRNVETAGDLALLAGARKAFEDRLFALARAHDILTRENWESAGLRDIVMEVIAPHRGGPAGREPFRVDGPDLRLVPAMALSLAMAVHELCTNGVKYGALSQPGGTVRITWTEEADGGRRQLHLTWRERGGPSVIPPTRKGFGTRLLERGLTYELGGAVRLTYDPAGLLCTITVPLE